jgi:hypothetical protein
MRSSQYRRRLGFEPVGAHNGSSSSARKATCACCPTAFYPSQAVAIRTCVPSSSAPSRATLCSPTLVSTASATCSAGYDAVRRCLAFTVHRAQRSMAQPRSTPSAAHGRGGQSQTCESLYPSPARGIAHLRRAAAGLARLPLTTTLLWFSTLVCSSTSVEVASGVDLIPSAH